MSEPNRSERPPRQIPGKPPTPPNGISRFGRNAFAWVIIISLAIALFIILQYNHGRTTRQISYSDLLRGIDAGTLNEFVVSGTEINGRFDANRSVVKDAKNDTVSQFYTDVQSGVVNADFLRDIFEKNKNAKMVAENHNDLMTALLIQLVPWLVIIGAIYFFLFRQLKNSAGAGGMLGNFGRSKHRVLAKEHTNVTFEDIAGIDEAKDEVREIVEFLKDAKRFQRLGGRIPRGVLLMGEPGTGKTLLAKAIAGEADVPFFSISGSDFVEMFVGVGASRVRDLFKQAKDNSPCIIFLDEIDAVGRRRGSGFSSGGHDEREQTLNAILVEMDGFETNDQVIVVAATNRLDVLDPALTRPGRFDRTVTVPLPDVKGRFEILKVHARKVKLGPNVDLARLARATPGFSGADLAATINESALGATLADKDFIEQDDLEEARDKVRFGRARKSRVFDD